MRFTGRIVWGTVKIVGMAVGLAVLFRIISS